MNPAWIALISAVAGGGLLKFIDVFFLSKTKKADIAADYRDELRDDIKGLRQEVKDMSNDLDKWKLRYYDLLAWLTERGIEVPEHLKSFK